jgi:hypothetical protein
MWRVQSPLAFAQNGFARGGVVGTQGDGLRPTGRGGVSVPTERPPRRPMSAWRRVLSRKAMSARRPRHGEALLMV